MAAGGARRTAGPTSTADIFNGEPMLSASYVAPHPLTELNDAAELAALQGDSKCAVAPLPTETRAFRYHKEGVAHMSEVATAMASETASQPAALNASQPPWCFLLAAHLHFGAVEWWGPADMLRLRAVSRVLRSPWSTSDFITAVLSQGLGWTLPREDLAERDGVEGALRLRCAFCCRLYLERVLLHAIPNVAAAAAGVDPSTNSTPCVTIGATREWRMTIGSAREQRCGA